MFTPRLEFIKGDDPVTIPIVELHLPTGAVELVGLGLIEVPFAELVDGYESVLRGNVNLWEEQTYVIIEVKAVIIVDEVLLLLEELLPFLHVLVWPTIATMEEAVVFVLPFLVL
jgi:hypothetical protein